MNDTMPTISFFAWLVTRMATFLALVGISDKLLFLHERELCLLHRVSLEQIVWSDERPLFRTQLTL